MHIKLSIYYKSNLIFQLCLHCLLMGSLFSISAIELSNIPRHSHDCNLLPYFRYSRLWFVHLSTKHWPTRNSVNHISRNKDPRIKFETSAPIMLTKPYRRGEICFCNSNLDRVYPEVYHFAVCHCHSKSLHMIHFLLWFVDIICFRNC